MSKKFYTDGVKTIKRDIESGDIIPDGFKPGRTFNANPWCKGLTKDDPRISSLVTKMRETRIANDSFHSWNKGLTTDTCESLRSTSKKLKGHKCFVTD